MDHFLSFDPLTGILRCEPGVLLGDIQKIGIPQGWMLPVTPGTQFVTIGGAIANDVHGKNHHRHGSFGDHIVHLTLARSDGQKILCSPEHNSDWLAATIGGCGLTGIITECAIQLKSVSGPWLNTETITFSALDEFFALADESEDNWEYTVSWIDCTSAKGRGVFLRANSSDINEYSVDAPKKKLRIPLSPPFSLMNSVSLKILNETYYNVNKFKKQRGRSHYEPFFYPLDNILEWNKIYGPKGFFQYQCLVPRDNGITAIDAMLSEIAKSRQGSFLAVLKTFGDRVSKGMLGFAKPGVTLALDFANRADATERLLKNLDAIVNEYGGRLYLAKDARMPRELFRTGYPNFENFLAYHDPRMTSSLSQRLMGI